MSFLNVILTENFISVISDGQITEHNSITQENFQKFYVSKNHFVIGITGYEKIVRDIKKRFHYFPKLSYQEAQLLLIDELRKYRKKQNGIGKLIRFNAVIAGFTDSSSVSSARTFHIEKGEISTRDYSSQAVLSLCPDDISFNPNQLIAQNISLENGKILPFQAQALQRSTLFKVAEQSNAVNKIIFQELIENE
ncbi:hypothetical protein ACFO26_01520 [Lactococcus nasutitermitis]|uniref:Uncharacterized protein n=1 Tax=Lactococcus nasutitermitis TaxID=1652957 RepID=A0ABV9JAQ4_9LACT|nr:hypothetical protein [Lactococcus nasutitermitis]